LLHEVNHTNLIFQRNEMNVGKAYDNLCFLLMFLARKIFKPIFLNNDVDNIIENLNNNLAFKQIEECDFGVEYYQM
jgi:hypothetical protein